MPNINRLAHTTRTAGGTVIWIPLQTILRQSNEREAQWNEEGLSQSQKLERIFEEVPEPRGRGIFPVEQRWALEWADIEEDIETASTGELKSPSSIMSALRLER